MMVYLLLEVEETLPWAGAPVTAARVAVEAWRVRVCCVFYVCVWVWVCGW